MSAKILDEYGVSPWNAAVKRCSDVIGALAGLIIGSPIFLIVFIMIKMEDSGSVIFRQERVGYRGRLFTIYKFRSMIPGAEKDGEPQLSREDDDRLTRVGRFLRDHHLDELPQLWNVLIGDMSIVGPRPERKCFVDQIMKKNQGYRLLYRLRPGLFSEATLYNGYTDTMEKMLIRLESDLDYLKNQSFLLDAKIIVMTLYSLLSGKKF
ncbi:MAG: sugar transferase [Bacteroidetes bacterium]|uniref:Sugar transferase n=1 Tax=Candidatus Cryptobacteroides excrementipullorum TaxID=2840761 RepID=A0A9D9IW59_9BACT|nr:sugar transferase [Candidatus Cryptobacteroides excrementipullorum]